MTVGCICTPLLLLNLFLKMAVNIEESALHYHKEVLEKILDVYPNCEDDTLENLLELPKNTLNIFI